MKRIKRFDLIVIIITLLFIAYVAINYDKFSNQVDYFFNNISEFNEKTGLNSIISYGNKKSAYSDLEDSKITGEDIYIDKKKNIYYSFLNLTEKKLYRQIYANIIRYEDKFIPVVDVKSDTIQKVIESIFNDHPEIIYLNSKYNFKYTDEGEIIQIILSYNDLYYKQEEFNNEVDKIVNIASKYKTDFEKEKFVHDYLINEIKYDVESKYNQSAYSGLILKNTVCAGYARSFQLIMNKLGIDTYYVTGKVEEGEHAWNIIKLNDNYYNVDLTWDDNNKNIYYYFNKSDNNFNSSHTRSELSKSLFTCDNDYNITDEYKKPEVNIDDIINEILD